MATRPEQRLESVIAGYLQKEARGEAPDRQQLLADHPELADSLRAFFLEHDRIRAAAVVPTSPWPSPPVPARAAADPLHARPGSRFGDYDLEEVIGRGGMGVVFRAWQRPLRRTVAVKVLRAGVLADGDELARFVHEARTAAALDHPSIVPVFDVGEQDGIPYFSMAYVQGRTLAELVRRGPLDPDQAAWSALEIAKAIDYAHQRGVVHRDLKPANVLVDSSGRPYITDFGLAKTRLEGAPRTLTGQVLGTPAFMAPEQALGLPRQHGPPVDIYGLGALLYCLLTGRPPLEADNALEMFLKLRGSEPPRPRSLNPRIPRPLEQICLKCLEKRPRDRYASASELADDLERYLRREPIQARHPDAWNRLRTWTRRFPLLVAHWVMIALALMIVVFNAVFFPGDAPLQSFYARMGLLLAGWGSLCGILQALMARPRWRIAARWLWAGIDVLLLTTAIVMAKPPRGPLLVGYPLLIAASGLFFQVRFVAFMTAINVAAFSVLATVLRDEPIRPANAVCFAAGLFVLGLIVGGIVRHLVLLYRFYERPKTTGA